MQFSNGEPGEAKPESAKTSSAKPSPAKPAAAKPPVAKSSSAKPETKPEPAKSESAKPSSSKATSAKTPAKKSSGLNPETQKLLLYYVAPMALAAVSTMVVIAIASSYGDWSKPADKKLQSGIGHIVRKYPALKPMYKEAMGDGVLTKGEAYEINEESKRLKGN